MSPGYGAIHGPTIAIAMIPTTMTSPISAGRSRANFLRISPTRRALKLLPQARVEQPVHQVGQDVDRRIDDADQEGYRQHDLVVGGEDRLYHVIADPRPVENCLDDDGPGDQRAEQQPDLRYRGDDRIAQHINPDQPTARIADRALVQHEILLQGFEHAGPGKAGDRRQPAERQSDRRQDQMPQRIPERVEAAGEQAVDQQEAGDVRRWQRCRCRAGRATAASAAASQTASAA